MKIELRNWLINKFLIKKGVLAMKILILNENKDVRRVLAYDWKLKSWGNKFEVFVFNLIINKSHRTAKSICKNLNFSNIGYEDWSVKEEEKRLLFDCK